MPDIKIAEGGNLFETGASVIVNPVNTVGVMGKGLALEFLRRYPENFRHYAAACARKRLKPGGILVFGPQTRAPRYIANLATKDHWRNPSKLEYVERGMADLALWLSQNVALKQVDSIAIPALGCGLGGLEWNEVLPVIRTALDGIDGLRAIIIPPHETVRARRLVAHP